MSINIKNPEANALIHELATLKGISLTAAVKLAVKEEIHRVKSAEPLAATRYERLMKHAREYSRRVKNPIHSWDIDSFLYDEKTGLPK